MTSPKKKNFSKQVVEKKELLKFFGGVPLLSDVSEQDLDYLCENCQTFFYPKGSIIFRPEEPSDWMYFIFNGLVVEFVGYGYSVDIIVKTRKKYDYIGEMGMLTDTPYSNTAVAMENLTLIAVHKKYFLELTWKNHSITKYIITQLVDRLNNSAKKMINAMYLDAPGRLAFTLVALAGDADIKSASVSVTQSDIAASAGIARQTVAKILSDWRKDGYISTIRGKIIINNLDSLLDIIVSSELK